MDEQNKNIKQQKVNTQTFKDNAGFIAISENVQKFDILGLLFQIDKF